MKYQCLSCKQTFVYAAKKTETIQKYTYANDPALSPSNIAMKVEPSTFETHVCPYCQSLDFTEYIEPEPAVQNVYIYDLTSGPQTELDGLLAQGFKITAKYAKQYHLEKLKEEVKKE